MAQNLVRGKERLEDLKSKIVLKKADAWDGQDAAEIEEEIYDYDDDEEDQSGKFDEL